MRKMIRAPLTWMVLAEFVVVAALVVVAWRVVSTAARPVLSSPALLQPDVVAESPSPPPELPPAVKPGPRAPLPGLNVDSLFWRSRLDQLNREQVFFEQLEWRIVHTATDTVQRYLETVVLPSVRRAERGGG
jgi:hypothetical protein